MNKSPIFKWRPLGELCEVSGGSSAPQDKESFSDGTIPFVRMRDLGGYHQTTCLNTTRDFVSRAAVEKKHLKMFEPGCILFPRSGSVALNHRAILGMRACIVSHIGILQHFSEDIDARYLYWFLVRYDMGEIAKQTTGLDLVNFSDIKKISIPVTPLPEQRRIVAEIEKQFTRLEAGVAALRRVQANLNRYRAAVLKAACEGDWPRKPLGDVAEIKGGIQKQPIRAPVKNHFPYLRVANVLRGHLDLSELCRMELFGDELTKLRLQSGDLLIVEGNGSLSEIGRMAIWNDEVKDCVHQNHIIRARLKKGVLPKFVAIYWNSPEGQRYIGEVASSTSGLYTLSVRKIGRLELPVPPLAEQKQIVAEVERRLSVVEELTALVIANLQRAARLRQSILQRAFEGNLV